jgi:RNA polymerase sigma factor (sigma-70 family)
VSSEDLFRHIYAANFEALLAYAVRRVDQPEDASDVVAETFLVAWRRNGDLPPDDEVRLWLYGVARRVLANHHRSGTRRDRLGERLRQRLSAMTSADPGHEVPQRLVVREALKLLSDTDREILMLTAWEGLEPREVAEVIGASPVVVRTRLSRARKRMRDLVGHDHDTPGHVLDVLTFPVPKEGR